MTSRTCPGRCAANACASASTATPTSTAARVASAHATSASPLRARASRTATAPPSVCDATRRVCVECADDNDCTPSQHCGAAQLCLSDLCTAGSTRCTDLATQLTCDPRGVTEVPAPCPGGQTCRGARCEPTVCTPGSTRCSSAAPSRPAQSTAAVTPQGPAVRSRPASRRTVRHVDVHPRRASLRRAHPRERVQRQRPHGHVDALRLQRVVPPAANA